MTLELGILIPVAAILVTNVMFLFRHSNNGKHVDPKEVVYRDTCASERNAFRDAMEAHSANADRRLEDLKELLETKLDAIKETVAKVNGRQNGRQ